MNLTESVRFVLSEEDKFLLSTIAKQEGDSSMSATIRRWIRQEAERRGIKADIDVSDNLLAPEGTD